MRVIWWYRWDTFRPFIRCESINFNANAMRRMPQANSKIVWICWCKRIEMLIQHKQNQHWAKCVSIASAIYNMNNKSNNKHPTQLSVAVAIDN